MRNLFTQLVSPFYTSVQKSLFGSVSYVQHLLMKAAVATSLKLCLFTARILLGSTAKPQPSRSF